MHVVVPWVWYAMPAKPRRGRQIPWNYSSWHLLATIWVLGTDPMSFGRTPGALNVWVIPLAPSCKFFSPETVSFYYAALVVFELAVYNHARDPPASASRMLTLGARATPRCCFQQSLAVGRNTDQLRGDESYRRWGVPNSGSRKNRADARNAVCMCLSSGWC